MSRKRAREVAMQTLFQLEFNKPDSEDEDVLTTILQNTWNEGKSASEADFSYSKQLVYGVCKQKSDIDSLLNSVSKEWKLSRMSGIDRNILRLAVYEIKWGDDNITMQIAINEAVELAKRFGSDDSFRFVNGVLGAVVTHTH